MNLDQLDLFTPVDISETKKETASIEDNVDESNILTANVFDEMLNAKVTTETTKEIKEVIDTTDYTVDAPHILIDTKSLLKVLSQVTTVLDTNSKRAVSRGITLIPINNSNVEIISPNELYYFKTILEVENSLPTDITLFMEYLFLQKIARFLPPKVLIYQKDSKFYIRLTTGDLELLNTTLIGTDTQFLKLNYEVTNECIKEMNLSNIYNSLSTLSKIVNFESDSPRKLLSTTSGLSSFKSALVYAGATTELPDITLKPKEMEYLMKAAQLAGKDETIKVYKTTSELTRYAFTYGTTTMITNYTTPKDDVKVKELLDNTPDLTVIDYSDLKYHLDYANSIIYAYSVITIVNEGGNLIGKIKLQNGSESPVSITTLSPITIPENANIKVNTKTLLQSLNALNPSLETKIGYKDGLLYLVNSDITLIIVSMGV